MKKYACLLSLSIFGVYNAVQSFAPTTVVEEKIKILRDSVRSSYNPIVTILNKSYRLPTQQEYQERLQLAIHVLNTTGKSRLLRETSGLGYQSSWLKKHKLLNTAVETVKYSPTLSTLVTAAGLFTFAPEVVVWVVVRIWNLQG